MSATPRPDAVTVEGEPSPKANARKERRPRSASPPKTASAAPKKKKKRSASPARGVLASSLGLAVATGPLIVAPAAKYGAAPGAPGTASAAPLPPRIIPEAGFAKRKKAALVVGPDGRFLCRWCNGPVPPPKITFCSPECIEQHRIRSNPSFVREVRAPASLERRPPPAFVLFVLCPEVFRRPVSPQLLLKRDAGCCALCGVNAQLLFLGVRLTRFVSTAGFSFHPHPHCMMLTDPTCPPTGCGSSPGRRPPCPLPPRGLAPRDRRRPESCPQSSQPGRRRGITSRLLLCHSEGPDLAPALECWLSRRCPRSRPLQERCGRPPPAGARRTVTICSERCCRLPSSTPPPTSRIEQWPQARGPSRPHLLEEGLRATPRGSQLGSGRMASRPPSEPRRQAPGASGRRCASLLPSVYTARSADQPSRPCQLRTAPGSPAL